MFLCVCCETKSGRIIAPGGVICFCSDVSERGFVGARSLDLSRLPFVGDDGASRESKVSELPFAKCSTSCCMFSFFSASSVSFNKKVFELSAPAHNHFSPETICQGKERCRLLSTCSIALVSLITFISACYLYLNIINPNIGFM